MDKKSSKKNELLVRKIKKDLSDSELVPVKVWRGGSLSAENADMVIDYTRAFIIIEAVKKNGNRSKKLIYKRRITAKKSYKLQMEAASYGWILPRVYGLLPADIQKHIEFPRLIKDIKERGKTAAFLRENIEGEICGDYHGTKKNIWNEKDLEIIIEVIKGFQKIDPKKIPIEVKERDVTKIYKEKCEDNIGYLEKLLGKGYEEKYRLLEKETDRQIKEQKPVFLSLDIVCYNIIKMKDGRLSFFDWEAPFIGKDPSLDYRRLILKLWTNPVLQKAAIALALKANENNKYFKDLLRANLVRGSYLNYHCGELKNKDKNRARQARAAIKSFKNLLKDALDNKGIWGNNR